jgi:molybdopterin/thiamine biosynthesis adenylyltransferase
MLAGFDYSQAFSRNIGWVTDAEQLQLQATRIAIAGMGGVGGEHLLTLTRLGVGHFRIADYDTFDIANMNRQAGASVSTLGRQKAHVMAELAMDINPDVKIEVWDRAVDSENVEDFLAGTNVYVDALDFFAFDARKNTFEACRRLGIPAVTAAPLGMGTALLTFLPNTMSFEDYFGWNGCDDTEKALRFMIGLAPRLLQDYLADPSKVNLAVRKGPSTIMACRLCAGVAATEVLKIVLKRGVVRVAPRGLQFDAYRSKMVKTWRPWGWRNPIQRVMIAFGRKRLEQLRRSSAVE